MNRQKLACLGFVLSIFAFLGTARAQQPWSHRLPWETRSAERQINSPETEVASFANANTANKLAAPDATWVQSAGPETGNTFALLRTNSGRLLQGTFGGLFISDDNGETWAINGNFFANGRGFASLATNGTAIFAGTNNNGGIFRSTNNGATWTAINSGFTAGRSINSLITNGNNIIAVTFSNEVYVSNNNGDAWVRGGMGLPATLGGPLLNRIANNNGIFYLTNYAEATPSLYRSTDNGANWVKLNPNLPAGQTVSLIAANGIRAFLGVANGPPRFSDDGGQTWLPFRGLTASAGARGTAFVVNGNDVYAFVPNPNGIEGAVYASSDSGETWTLVSHINDLLLAYSYAAEGQTLYLGGFDGISRSQDGGKTFERKNRGLRSNTAFNNFGDGGFAQIGNRLFVRSFGGGVWSTTDNGATWKQHKQGFPSPAIVSTLLGVGNTLYAALEQPFSFYRSTDLGETWTLLGTGLPPSDFNTFPDTLAFRNGKLYLGLDGNGLYVSEDKGASFKHVTGGLPATARVWAVAFKDNSIFVTTNGTGVFRSTDGGTTFTPISTGLATMFTRSLVTLGERLFLCTNNAVYRSTDNGDNWTRLNGLFFFNLAVSGNRIHGVGGNGAQTSRDNGDTWQTNFNGLFGIPQSLTVSNNNLVITTNGTGVFFQPEDVSSFAVVNAASYNPNGIAPKTIVAAFGLNLAPATATAATQPLPLSLGGVSVKVKDANSIERDAPLFFVSAGQINFQLPANTANGAATITITHGSTTQTIVTEVVRAAGPGLFAANGSGGGAAAAFDAIKYTAGPFDAKQANGQPNFIAFFGTGFGSDATDQDGNVIASVTTRLNGVIVPTAYAGRAPGFTGLNQFNLQLPANIPTGTYTLSVTRGGLTSNSVTITIR